jgi:hypothetical protein
LSVVGSGSGGSVTLTSAAFTTAYNAKTLLPYVTYYVTTGTYSFTYIAGQYFLNVKNGDYVDLAFDEWVTVVRPFAAANQGRVGGLTIPSGNYSISSTTKTITLESWMAIKSMGTVKINHNGASVPTFWFRNDVTPIFPMGTDTATNTSDSATAEVNYAPHAVLDGTNGTFILQGTRTTGSCGIRHGNGDGVWGTEWTTNTINSSILSEFKGIHIMYMLDGLQFTNNNDFCSRWQNVWVSNTDRAIQTSTSSSETNTYEQHSFINFFAGNIYNTMIEMNSGGARDHQFSFLHSSLTQCPGPAVTLNAASISRLEFTQMRIENCLTVCTSTVASPRTWLRFNNVTIIPTNTYNGLAPFLRKMFVGTFNVQAVNTQFNLTGSMDWSVVAVGKADNQFLADDTVMVQHHNTCVDDTPSDYTASKNMRPQAIWNSMSSMLSNSGFANGLTNWTTAGTATVSTTSVSGEYFPGLDTVAIKIVGAAQYASLTSVKFPVRAGRQYYGDCVARYLDTSTSAAYIIPQVIWYAEDGTTVISTVTKAQNSTYQNWGNRKSATQWYRHPLGTGKLVAPAGACFAQYVLNISGTTATTGSMTGTMYLDNAMFVELT